MACFQLPSARVPVRRQNIVSFKFSQKFPVEGTGSSKITLSLYLMTFYIKQKSFGNEPFFGKTLDRGVGNGATKKLICSVAPANMRQYGATEQISFWLITL